MATKSVLVEMLMDKNAGKLENFCTLLVAEWVQRADPLVWLSRATPNHRNISLSTDT